MPIKVVCNCGKSLLAKDELAGKRVKCPKCGHATNISIPKEVVSKNELPDESPNIRIGTQEAFGDLNELKSYQFASSDSRSFPMPTVLQKHGSTPVTETRENKKLSRRTLVSLGVMGLMLVSGTVVVGFAYLLGTPGTTPGSGFDRIKPSMTRAEIEAILGKVTNLPIPFAEACAYYHADGKGGFYRCQFWQREEEWLVGYFSDESIRSHEKSRMPHGPTVYHDVKPTDVLTKSKIFKKGGNILIVQVSGSLREHQETTDEMLFRVLSNENYHDKPIGTKIVTIDF